MLAINDSCLSLNGIVVNDLDVMCTDIVIRIEAFHLGQLAPCSQCAALDNVYINMIIRRSVTYEICQNNPNHSYFLKPREE